VEKESESLTLAECFIHFVQQFMNIFLPSLNILQNDKTQCTQIYTEMTIVRNKLKSRIDNKFYGSEIRKSLINLLKEERSYFESSALKCYERGLKYIEEWFCYENNIFQMFEVLNLNSKVKWEEMVEIAEKFTINLDKDMLFDEIIGLNEFLERSKFGIEVHFMEKWSQFLNSCSIPNIELILEFVFSIYSSNAYIERVFSIMNNLCSKDRNKLLTQNLKAEICVKVNFDLRCSQFHDFVKNNDNILKAAKSNTKYTFKLNK
jgi:hypothetical protein